MRNVLILTTLFVGVVLAGTAFASIKPVAPEPVSTSLFLLGAGALGIKALKKNKK